MGALGLLFVVAQCGSSNDSGATATVTTTPAVETTVTSSTATSPVEPSTTIEDSTTTSTTVAPTTTTTTTMPEPTTTTIPVPVIDPNCPTTPHGAVIDRDAQRAWLCDNGVALPEFVVTTAREQPDPGTYPVFAKSMNATSRFGGHFSTMTHFVVFARGEKSGARVGFHTVPVLRNGDYAQPLASVGTQMEFGDTSGCIRVLPEQGQVIWDWLQRGDEVHVIT
jgi:L,D-transpeptidase catalytic domain